MNPQGWLLVLTAAWLALTGELTLANLLLGLALSGLVLAASGVSGTRGWRWPNPLALARFTTYYVKEVLVANLRVARDILDPRLSARPAVLAVELEDHTEDELLVLTSLLSFTPGTLTLDLSPDGRRLYVHAINVEDLEALRAGIKDGFETRVIEVMG